VDSDKTMMMVGLKKCCRDCRTRVKQRVVERGKMRPGTKMAIETAVAKVAPM
jgi:hypothetical protein